MKKIIFTILIIHLFLIIANAQWVQSGFDFLLSKNQNQLKTINTNSVSAWKWINPYPSNKTLYQTQFINENTGYSQIDVNIFRTTNGGFNWVIPGDTNVNSTLYFFENSTTGYKNCIGGIYKTTNSGINWLLFFPSITNFSISSINSLQSNYFMLSGSYYSPFGPIGWLWFTSNNGQNWITMQPGAQYISSLKLLRNDFALAVAIDSGKIFLLKSVSPSTHWDKIYTGINELYSANLFFKDDITYFLSASDILYKTTNAGLNWAQTNLTEIKSMQFPSLTIAIAVGKFGKIFRSINGGESWYQIQFPYLYNYESVTFCNSSTGYITGDFGSFLITTNAGANWSSDSKYFTTIGIRDVKAIGKDTLILCGAGGYIFTTYNQGLNWNIQNPGLNNYMFRIFFLDRNTGYTIGRNGTILKTTNTGQNWSLLNTILTEYWMNDIFFVNENTGFIATGTGGYSTAGYLYKTTNAGNNFYLVNTPVNNRFYVVRFININTGLLADIYGNIFRTTDLGNTWTATNTPQSLQSISDLQFINSSTGFAVGYNGYIIKTSDGGYNWSQYTRLNTTGLYRIKFVNNQTGYITAGGGGIGGNGDIFYTTNSGINWQHTYLDLDVNNNILFSVDFANDSLGYVVGEYGILLKTTTGGIVSVKKSKEVFPLKFSLYQNYPNPFNPITKIKFDIPAKTVGQTFLSVYDILGKEIATLVNEQLAPGTYTVDFDASNYSSGIYFYRLNTGDFSETKKMLLIK